MKQRLILPLLLLLGSGLGYAQGISIYTNGAITCSESAGTGGSGTVNSGTLNQVAYYPGAGTAVSGTSSVTGITLDGLDPTHVAYLLNLTSDAQAQITSNSSAIAANAAAIATKQPLLPASVQVVVASFAIPAHTCYGSAGSTTPATFSMPGLATNMKLSAGFTSNPSAITGWGAIGGLNIKPWPSAAATGSYLICNPNVDPITGGTITFIMGAQL